MRTQTPFSLFIVDADQFKLYNDSFGHHAGDSALISIAECIAGGTTRGGSDFGARYSGEEFVELLLGNPSMNLSKSRSTSGQTS